MFKTPLPAGRESASRVFVIAAAMPAAWIGVFASAHAQIQTLPKVSVTAAPITSQTLPPIEEARARLDETPGGANVVDAAEYREGRVSTLDDAFRFAPGIFVASRFGAEEARLSIRGSGLQRTFHMRGIALLQDGVPLNLSDGSVDFQAVEPLAARYVEVLRGANATQYGVATLGGAINFISPSGLDAPPASARVEAGSFGYKRAQVSLAGKTETADWHLAASEFFQKGYRNHARQDTQRLSGNVGWQLSPALETRMFLNVVDSDSALPGALTLAEMAAMPRKADPAAVSGDQHRNFTLVRLSNRTTYRIDPSLRLEAGAFTSVKSLFHPIFQVLDQDSDDYGVNARLIGDGVLFGRKNRLIVGGSLAQGSLDDDRYVNVGGQPAARTAQARQHSRNTILFAEDQAELAPGTALIAGAQAAEARRRLTDRYLADGDNSVDRTYRRVSPRVGVRHDLAPGIQVYGNVSGSFEPPTFSELFGGPNVTPVDAQRACTVEAGTRGRAALSLGSLRWDLSVYRARVRDELLALNDAAGNSLGTVNADRAVHQGVEAGLELEAGKSWTMRASYLFNDFRFDGDRVYGDYRLAGVPRQVFSGEVLYRMPNGFYLGPNVRLASATYVDHANTLRAPGYGIVGLKLDQQLNRRASWFVDARNLANKAYAATTGVVADARARDSRQFYPGDGRSLYAGIELKY